MDWTSRLMRLTQISVVLFVVLIGGALFAGQIRSSAWVITYAVHREGSLWDTHILDTTRRVGYPTGERLDTNHSANSGSPDGRYEVMLNEMRQLQIIDPVRGVVIANLTGGFNLSWSPDSHALIYELYGQYSRIMFVTISETGLVSEPQLLTGDNAFEAYNVDWSSQGRSLVFQGMDYVGDRSIGIDVFVVEVGEPDSLVNLSASAGNDFNPIWSPDGTQVAYVSNREGNHRLYLVEPDGSHVYEVTQDTHFIVAATWSPDGTKLAFVNLVDGLHHVHVVDLENDYAISPPLIVTLLEFPGRMQWSPDGEHIAFSTRDGEIFSAALDGSDLQRLIVRPQGLLLP